MTFPLNTINGQIHTSAAGVTYSYDNGAWNIVTLAPINGTPPDIVRQPTTQNTIIVEGTNTGLPYIQVNGTMERITLHSELDGSDHDIIEINAGYF